MLSVELPSGTVLGVFDLKANLSEGVADFIAGSPVLVALSLATDVKQEVYGLRVSLFALIAAAFLRLHTE